LPEEMATFVYNHHDRNYQSAPGKHDDRIMAMAIALQLIDLTAVRGRKATEPKKVADSSEWFRKRQRAYKERQNKGFGRPLMRLGRSERWPTAT